MAPDPMGKTGMAFLLKRGTPGLILILVSEAVEKPFDSLVRFTDGPPLEFKPSNLGLAVNFVKGCHEPFLCSPVLTEGGEQKIIELFIIWHD